MASRPRNAVKFLYNCDKDTWERSQVRLAIAPQPFAQGGMRLAYRAWEVLHDGSTIECVVKRFKPELGLPDEANFHEAMTQMVAEGHAQEFNKACAGRHLPHRVAFLPVAVLRLEGVQESYCLEPYLPGDYVKHSDNDGHNETEDEVAAAFSYFTYVTSNNLMVVCDIQGVGTFYTDPQIHTYDGAGFGAGNTGPEGIKRFLSSHTHSLLCEQLGLPSQDAGLTDEEIARKMQQQEDEEAMGSWAAAPLAWTSQRYNTGLGNLAQLLGIPRH